jgi:YidC/Oxa1 family membrane protein insertase
LKEFKRFEKNSGQLVELIKDNNSNLNIQLQTTDNRTLNTKDLYFEPTLTKNGADQILTMRLKAGANEFLEYKYVLKANDYLVGFDIRSQGLNKVLNSGKPLDLQWDLKSYRNEKGVSIEKRYAQLEYEYGDKKYNYVSDGVGKEDTPEKVSYIAFKQHFFTAILATDKPFEKSKLQSDALIKAIQGNSSFSVF